MTEQTIGKDSLKDLWDRGCLNSYGKWYIDIVPFWFDSFFTIVIGPKDEIYFIMTCHGDTLILTDIRSLLFLYSYLQQKEFIILTGKDLRTD